MDNIRIALYADENGRYHHITIDKALDDKARGILRRYKCPGLSEKCLADVIPVREGVTSEGVVFPAHFREAKHGKKHGKNCEYDSKITIRRTPSADPKLLSLKKLLAKASKEETGDGNDEKRFPLVLQSKILKETASIQNFPIAKTIEISMPFRPIMRMMILQVLIK